MKVLLLLSGVNPSLFAAMPPPLVAEKPIQACTSAASDSGTVANHVARFYDDKSGYALACLPDNLTASVMSARMAAAEPPGKRGKPAAHRNALQSTSSRDTNNLGPRRAVPEAGVQPRLGELQLGTPIKAKSVAVRPSTVPTAQTPAIFKANSAILPSAVWRQLEPAAFSASAERKDSAANGAICSMVAGSLSSEWTPLLDNRDTRARSAKFCFTEAIARLSPRRGRLFDLMSLSALESSASRAADAIAGANAGLQSNSTPDAGSAQASQQPQAETERGERIVTLSLPVRINERTFLPITASITTERVVSVPATDILRTLAEVVDDRTLDSIGALGDRFVDVSELAQLGVLVTLNPATLSLEIVVSPGILRRATVMASSELTFSGVERVEPSDFSFGMTTGLIASSPLDEGFDPRALLGFAGFLNIGGIEGFNLDYGGDFALNNAGERSFFQRDRITAFKDWPEKALRVSAGDLLPNQARLAGSFDIAGLSLERNYEALQPIRNIRPTASRSLQLDRRSVVEVYVNEVLVERFFAEPGPLDITQIPLASFSNNVKIIVEDSLGRREVDSFVFGSDITLLGEGIDQFDFALGFLRNAAGNGFSYSNDLVASAFYERGLTTNFTIAGHALISGANQNIGGAAAIGVPVGTITADIAFSNDDLRGRGLAAGMTFRGSPFFGAEQGEFATLTVDYRSAGFTTIGDVGVINNIKFDLRAEYQVNVTERSAVFASANYAQPHGDRGADSFYSAGVRHNFGFVFVTLAGRYADRANIGGELGVLVTLTVPMGRRESVTATYDTASSRGRAEFRRQRGLSLPEVDYRVGVSTDPRGESVFGSVGYANSRFDADADVATRFGSGGAANQTVASARLQTGFGFADGKLAFGRDPGRGFAILSRHPSIEDSTLVAKTSAAGRELGIANDFGPGLLAVNAPFRPQQVTVEARDIPIGYNIGAGRYLLESGARSGLVITVGSENYRTLVTTLLYDGQPVSLEYGRYRRSGDDPTAAVTFFTNRAGRAAFADLGPGEYLIEFPERGIEGRFTIEKDADALIRIDRLEMRRR